MRLRADSIVGMSHFSPSGAPARPCWFCVHFVCLVHDGTAAACNGLTGPRVRSMPAAGCAFWLREVGADDEPDAVPASASAAAAIGALAGPRAARG